MDLRLFIAIELSDRLRAALAGLQERMRREMPPLKWVNSGSIHLTLKFIGSTQEKAAGDIAEIMDVVAAQYSPFIVSFSGVGAFPTLRRPRVIWLGVERGREAVCDIARNLENALETMGIEMEKREFKPHLTLARAKKLGPRQDMAKILSYYREEEIGEMRASEISLIRSTLTPHGPLYRTIHTSRLC